MSSQLNFQQLRAKHLQLSYDRASATQTSSGIHIEWQFTLSPDLVFHPQLDIPFLTQQAFHPVDNEVLQHLAFQLGMVELLSYWKAACPAQIVIRAGWLSADQVGWWQDLIINGLGEFFYTNHIDFTQPDLVTVNIEHQPPTRDLVYRPQLDATAALIPVGGGKDSAVTLELIKKLPQLDCLPWAINPSPASRRTAQTAGYSRFWAVERRLDPLLLQLNQQGYLNGHTPFSALVAFTSVILGVLTGSRSVLLSNEVSANECNATYQGHEINHQYSKSFAFETKFHHYCQTYLAQDFQYLSLLRPLNELQIAQQFTTFPHFFSDFLSCNVGQKTDTWCHHCPKCLFAFTMLFPFVDEQQLTTTIFDHNLFADESLIELALKLVLPDKEKPFECVGSYQETKVAFYLASQKYHAEQQPLPPVLQAINDQVLHHEPNLPLLSDSLLTKWNNQHLLPNDWAAQLFPSYYQQKIKLGAT